MTNNHLLQERVYVENARNEDNEDDAEDEEGNDTRNTYGGRQFDNWLADWGTTQPQLQDISIVSLVVWKAESFGSPTSSFTSIDGKELSFTGGLAGPTPLSWEAAK